MTGHLSVSMKPPPVKPIGNLSADFFFHYAADDYVVDARELRDLLNELARRGMSVFPRSIDFKFLQSCFTDRSFQIFLCSQINAT